MSAPDIRVRCDKCSNDFSYPFPTSVLYQATCPKCSEKNLRYIGTDQTITKMILERYGVTRNTEDDISTLKTQIIKLQGRLDDAISDSKAIMTTALVNAVEETIRKHEETFHNFKVPR